MPTCRCFGLRGRGEKGTRVISHRSMSRGQRAHNPYKSPPTLSAWYTLSSEKGGKKGEEKTLHPTHQPQRNRPRSCISRSTTSWRVGGGKKGEKRKRVAHEWEFLDREKIRRLRFAPYSPDRRLSGKGEKGEPAAPLSCDFRVQLPGFVGDFWEGGEEKSKRPRSDLMLSLTRSRGRERGKKMGGKGGTRLPERKGEVPAGEKGERRGEQQPTGEVSVSSTTTWGEKRGREEKDRDCPAASLHDVGCKRGRRDSRRDLLSHEAVEEKAQKKRKKGKEKKEASRGLWRPRPRTSSSRRERTHPHQKGREKKNTSIESQVVPDEKRLRIEKEKKGKRRPRAAGLETPVDRTAWTTARAHPYETTKKRKGGILVSPARQLLGWPRRLGR